MEGSEESIEIVYAVRLGSVFLRTICGSSSDSVECGGIGAQIRPLHHDESAQFKRRLETFLPCMSNHESHLLRRNILSRYDEVSLILSVCRVKDDYKFSPRVCFDCVFDAVEVQLRLPVDIHLIYFEQEFLKSGSFVSCCDSSPLYALTM
jgi:hypothetical protein